MAHSHSIREYPGQLAALMALAAAVGAITALLTTPITGRQSRDKIKGGASNIKGKIPRSKSEMADTADKIAKKTADKIDDSAAKTNRAARSATAKTRTATRSSRRTTGDVADRIREQGEP